MKDKELWTEIERIKSEAARLLQAHGDDSYVELWRIVESDIGKLCQDRDEELLLLAKALYIWGMENEDKKEPHFLSDIDSLEDAVVKMRRLVFYLYRIDNGLEEELVREGIDFFLSRGLSLQSIWWAAGYYLRNRVDAVLTVCGYYQRERKNRWVMGMIARMRADEIADDRLNLMMAEEWMKVGQFDRACAELRGMENPAPEVEEMIDRLSGVTNG